MISWWMEWVPPSEWGERGSGVYPEPRSFFLPLWFFAPLAAHSRSKAPRRTWCTRSGPCRFDCIHHRGKKSGSGRLGFGGLVLAALRARGRGGCVGGRGGGRSGRGEGGGGEALGGGGEGEAGGARAGGAKRWGAWGRAKRAGRGRGGEALGRRARLRWFGGLVPAALRARGGQSEVADTLGACARGASRARGAELGCRPGVGDGLGGPAAVGALGGGAGGFVALEGGGEEQGQGDEEQAQEGGGQEGGLVIGGGGGRVG